MKQPERSNENLSWSKVNARRQNFGRTARVYAALAALLLIFVFSLSNATGASGQQTNQPNARQGEVVLDGIRYSPLTNGKGQTIYVPTIATPEYVARTIEENIKLIKDVINGELKGIYEEESIEELTIEHNLEQKLTAYLFLAAENDGNAATKTMKELGKIEEELDYPIIMTYGNFNVTKLNGKTYLIPIKIKEPDGYLATLKLNNPEERPYCDAEATITIRITQKGAKETDMKTQENNLIYDKSTADWIEEDGMDAFTPLPYDLFKPAKPTKEETWIHLCVKKESNNPKKATTYLSAPFVREYKQWAHASK